MSKIILICHNHTTYHLNFVLFIFNLKSNWQTRTILRCLISKHRRRVSFFIISLLECHLPSSSSTLSDVNFLLLALDSKFSSTYHRALILLFFAGKLYNLSGLLFQTPSQPFSSARVWVAGKRTTTAKASDCEERKKKLRQISEAGTSCFLINFYLFLLGLAGKRAQRRERRDELWKF